VSWLRAIGDKTTWTTPEWSSWGTCRSRSCCQGWRERLRQGVEMPDQLRFGRDAWPTALIERFKKRRRELHVVNLANSCEDGSFASPARRQERAQRQIRLILDRGMLSPCGRRLPRGLRGADGTWLTWARPHCLRQETSPRRCLSCVPPPNSHPQHTSRRPDRHRRRLSVRHWSGGDVGVSDHVPGVCHDGTGNDAAGRLPALLPLHRVR
jgi:hypothetical protein